MTDPRKLRVSLGTLCPVHFVASERLLPEPRELCPSPHAKSAAADRVNRQWFGILAAVVVLYTTLPGDPALLPLLASCASVVPQAAMDAIEWTTLNLREWRYAVALTMLDAEARLISSVEEGRGSADTSNFRIDSDSEDDAALPPASSSRPGLGGNGYTNNADVARCDLAPGAVRAL